ncbi:MAG TPA: hypothetical protein VGS58_20365 [Candidatus Sulfopaludibacter sp.]|nr:hypothetical protein [Candidatus Sulfopaludibacter sp.]
MLLKDLEFSPGVEVGAGFVMERIGLPHHHQPLGMRIGKRAQEHAFHQAEDGGVCPDAQRQRQHCHQRKSARAPQLASGIKKIAAQVREQPHSHCRVLRCDLRFHVSMRLLNQVCCGDDQGFPAAFLSRTLSTIRRRCQETERRHAPTARQAIGNN